MKYTVFTVFMALFAAVSLGQDPGCNIVSMAQWAGESSLRKENLPNPVNTVIIQHTVTPEATTEADCEKVLNAIRKYQRSKGFDDVTASFLICGNGKVYEGAGWSLVGAHTKGYNNRSAGIAFVGEFTSHLPDAAALTAAKELIACGVINKHLSEGYNLVGHRQVTATLSPGDALQKEVETWPQWAETA